MRLSTALSAVRKANRGSSAYAAGDCLRDAQDGVHIAFNTCQNCTPSPKAFYTQEGDVLKCENCGFTFAAEEVGIVHGGCNPWPIDGVEITADTVMIPAAALDAMKASFARWGGPVK